MVISLFWCIFAVLFRFFQILICFLSLWLTPVMFGGCFCNGMSSISLFWCIFGVLFRFFSDYFRHRSISLWLIPVIFGGYFSNGMSLILLFYYFKIQSIFLMSLFL